MAYTALLVSIALLLILLSEVDLTVRYDGELCVTFYVAIFAIAFTKRDRADGSNRNRSSDKRFDRSLRRKRTHVYLNVLLQLIEGTEITLNELSIPNSFGLPYVLRYRELATVHAVISVIIAYLSSKALKINEDYGEYIKEADAFSVDLSLKMRVFNVLRALIKLKRRLRSAYAKNERKNDVRN